MVEFYPPNFTSFTLGSITVLSDNASARSAMEAFLEKYSSIGVGADIHLHHSRVEPVSTQSAICWITWKMMPRNGERRWTFTDPELGLLGERAAAGAEE